MTKTEILQHIAKNGTCGELHASLCTKCPLSKLKKRPNGDGWLSCFEAVGAINSTDIKAKYKEAASLKLIEMAIEGAITDVDEDEKSDR